MINGYDIRLRRIEIIKILIRSLRGGARSIKENVY